MGLVPSRPLTSTKFKPAHLLFSHRRFSKPKHPRPRVSLPKPLTPVAVAAALRSHPSSAATIFRHAAARRGYRHTSLVYHEMLRISLSRRHFSIADSLIDEVISGACPDPDLPLFNDIIRFCCQRNHLFSAFDVLQRMRQLGGRCLPTVETYAVILDAILRQFDKSNTRYVYMRSVKCLVHQMRDSGLFPDAHVMNLVIKACSRCSEVDVALKLFEEMLQRNCLPSELTYGYLVQGFFENERIVEGMRFYSEMRDKGFVPTAGVYMVVINSLSMAKRFDEGVKVMFDMLENMKTPDLLTYRTVLEGLCRQGRRNEAFDLLEKLKGKRRAMNQKAYSYLLDGLHWLCQDPSRI